MTERLAIDGGKPVRVNPLPAYRTIGPEEEGAALSVIQGGVLSKFLGAWTPDFFGGPQVQALETEWAAYFGVAHAVSMNSATSGLYAAVGATGVGPGDEVIVSPYTMSASAACVLGYNAIPVFADVDPRTFNITAETIEHVITEQTKAIVVVDLFGLPADFDQIMALARKHHLIVIEDAAQAPGARYNGRFAGTLADMGIYSLNYHKTIHCGEGGVVVTDNKRLAERLQLIRNHGEVVVAQRNITDLVNMLGFNYRMTEVEATMAREQLKKLELLLNRRWANAARLDATIGMLDGLVIPYVPDGIKHGYYVYAFKIDTESLKVDRALFAAALNAEGIPVYEGYVQPIYWQPLYQQKILYGGKNCPFACPLYRGNVSYDKGLCSVVERLHTQELLYGDWCHSGLSEQDVDDIIMAICKVHANVRNGNFNGHAV